MGDFGDLISEFMGFIWGFFLGLLWLCVVVKCILLGFLVFKCILGLDVVLRWVGVFGLVVGFGEVCG